MSTVIEWHARGYFLSLLGNVVFLDKSREVVHPKYLGILRDICHLHMFSWGSACLDFMYRALCRASRVGTKQIDGALILLQAWAWWRLPYFAPVPNFRLVFPLANRWIGSTHRGDYLKTRVGFRRSLDQMGPDDFVWRPYQLADCQIPTDIMMDWTLFRVVVPLICFKVVEWHSIDRVLRQFGLEQVILADPQLLTGTHNRDLRSTPKAGDWPAEHAEWITRWAGRHSALVHGDDLDTYTLSHEYWDWYHAHAMGMVVSPEPLPSDPRQCPLPVHSTPAEQHQHEHQPPQSTDGWRSWEAASQSTTQETFWDPSAAHQPPPSFAGPQTSHADFWDFPSQASHNPSCQDIFNSASCFPQQESGHVGSSCHAVGPPLQTQSSQVPQQEPETRHTPHRHSVDASSLPSHGMYTPFSRAEGVTWSCVDNDTMFCTHAEDFLRDMNYDGGFDSLVSSFPQGAFAGEGSSQSAAVHKGNEPPSSGTGDGGDGILDEIWRSFERDPSDEDDAEHRDSDVGGEDQGDDGAVNDAWARLSSEQTRREEASRNHLRGWNSLNPSNWVGHLRNAFEGKDPSKYEGSGRKPRK